MSTSEAGMARILANFNTLIIEVGTMGAAYNPAANLKVPALTAQYNAAKAEYAAAVTAKGPYTTAVNDREAAFRAIMKRPSAVRNIMKAAGIPKEVIADADTIIRKMRGQGAPGGSTAAATPAAPAEATPGTPGGTPPPDPGTGSDSISVSQQSYAHKIDQWNQLIAFLSTLSAYAPTEAGLKVAGLTTMVAGLEAKNTVTAAKGATLKAARIARNAKLFGPVTGLVDTGNAVKNYVRAIFGNTSPQYHQIRSLRFVRSGHY